MTTIPLPGPYSVGMMSRRPFVLAVLLGVACAGPQLDANNMRTVSRLWSEVRQDGARAAQQHELALIDQMDLAVQTPAGPDAVLWDRIAPIVTRGIDSWEGVDDGVRASGRERVRLLGEAIRLLSRNRQ